MMNCECGPLRLSPFPSEPERELILTVDAVAKALSQSGEVDETLCRRITSAARFGGNAAGGTDPNTALRAALGLPMGYADRLAAELLLAGICPWGLTMAQAMWILKRLHGTAGADPCILDLLEYRIDASLETDD